MLHVVRRQCPKDCVREDESGGHAPPEDGEGNYDAALRDESLNEDEEQVQPWGGKGGTGLIAHARVRGG